MNKHQRPLLQMALLFIVFSVNLHGMEPGSAAPGTGNKRTVSKINDEYKRYKMMLDSIQAQAIASSAVPDEQSDTGSFTPDWYGIRVDEKVHSVWVAGSGVVAKASLADQHYVIDTVIRDTVIRIDQAANDNQLTLRTVSGMDIYRTPGSLHYTGIPFDSSANLPGYRHSYIPTKQEWRTDAALLSAQKVAGDRALISIFPDFIHDKSATDTTITRRFITGANGILLVSGNGAEWHRVETPATDSLWAVAEKPGRSDELFAVGNNGTIIRSLDSGEHWHRLTSPLTDAAKKPWPLLPAPWYYVAMAASLLVPFIIIRRKRRSIVHELSIANLLVSDRPLRFGDPDPLNFGRLAEGLSMFIRNRNCKPPLTLAITGEWGKGKSSIMNLLKDDLDRMRFPTVWFNAWHHEQEENILASLLQIIRSQAIPPWWTIIGMGFRIRLWFRRLSRNAAQLITTLLIITLAAGMLKGGNSWGATLRLENLISFFTSATAFQGLDKEAFGLLARLGGLGALVSLVFTILRMFKVFGIRPSVMASPIKERVTSRDLDAIVGFKQKFSQDFLEVTQALGQRNMTIIIDDLDRCSEKSVAQVLEFVNFLASCGEVFIVLGMNSEYVKCCVAEQFKDIAVRYYDLRHPNQQPGVTDVDKYITFAGDYLEKLVNIQIEVPTPDKTALGKIGIDEEVQSTICRKRIRSDTMLLQRISTVLVVSVVTVLLFFATFRVGMVLAPEKTGNFAQKNTIDSLSTGPGIVAAASDFVNRYSSAQPEDTADIVTTLRAFSVPAATIDTPLCTAPTPAMEITGMLIALLAMALVIQAMSRTGEIVRDSPLFIRALRDWNDLLCAIHQTPRGIKKFHNRVRYLAMMLRSRTEQISSERRVVGWGKMFDRMIGTLGRKPFFSVRWGLTDTSVAARENAFPEDILVGLCVLECYDKGILTGNQPLTAFREKLAADSCTATINKDLFAKLISSEAMELFRPRFIALANGSSGSEAPASARDSMHHTTKKV